MRDRGTFLRSLRLAEELGGVKFCQDMASLAGERKHRTRQGRKREVRKWKRVKDTLLECAEAQITAHELVTGEVIP